MLLAIVIDTNHVNFLHQLTFIKLSVLMFINLSDTELKIYYTFKFIIRPHYECKRNLTKDLEFESTRPGDPVPWEALGRVGVRPCCSLVPRRVAPLNAITLQDGCKDHFEEIY